MKKKQIIEKDGIQYEVIRIVKEKQKRVIVNNWDLTDYDKWYDKEYCIEAVKRNGYLLQYVKDQTPEICIEAVKSDGDSLRDVDQKVFDKKKDD